MLIIGKLMYLVGVVVFVVVGVGKMLFGFFVWWNLLGILLKIVLFVIVGYLFGYVYNIIDLYIFCVLMIMLVFMVVVVGIWFMCWCNVLVDEVD